MKVLFVTYHYLHGHGGGVFASRGFINAFASLSDEMTLLCPQKGEAQPAGIDPGVRIIPVRGTRSRMTKALSYLVGRIHRFFGLFDKVLASERFDTVVFDSCYVTQGLIGKARRTGCRVITIHHNYQCDYIRANEGFPSIFPTLFWTWVSERNAVRKSNLNLTLTAEDKDLLYRHYDSRRRARIEVIGVFEYERKATQIAKKNVEEPVFVITGNLSMRQTELPLLEWLESCYPVLKETIPTATVLVAGKNPSERLAARCKKWGVELIPSPRDMQAVLDRGRYYVCPASEGGGLKLRMMDGLKNGMPVLAHQAAARGYSSFLDRSVFCYMDAGSFRDALLRMVSMPYDREETIRLYRDAFSFDAGLKRLQELL